jgi:pimeloyl-ACP methyl ester carboxylesterase
MNPSVQLAQTLREFRATHPLRTLQIDACNWEYLSGGTGSNAILIVGGGGSTAESMFALHVALESNCRVVSVGIPSSVASADQIADGLAAVLDILKIDQAVLLGHSLGGLVVQCAALRHPERVAGLVLSHTGFYLGARAVLIPALAALMARAPGGLLLRMVNSQMERVLAASPDSGFWMDFFREELSQPGSGARLKRAMALLSESPGYFRGNPITASLPWAARLPVQVISAPDDRGFTRRETEFQASLYPRAQTTVFPTPCGHLSFLTKPRAYLEVVEAFLAAVWKTDSSS